MFTLEDLEKSEALQTIVIPLIVPTQAEVTICRNLDWSRYDLNACYGKPWIDARGKEQSWYDVQLTVNSEDYLPSRKEWFYMVTDNGYIFKACFTGKKIKKLNTFENKKIIGEWIKNLLVAWEALDEFQFVHQDRGGIGIVTKEALEFYGGDTIFIKKTSKTKKDKRGIERDVWFISFPHKNYLEECGIQ